MKDFKSSLTLQNLVFDQIEFTRKGFKQTSKLSFELEVQIGTGEYDAHRVTLILRGEKPEEYTVVISLSGFFKIEGTDQADDKAIQSLINKNAVAIMMPYLRSELTLLTAQPNTDSVVLPPFNINKMFDEQH